MSHKDGGGGFQLIKKSSSLKLNEPTFSATDGSFIYSQQGQRQLPQYQIGVYDHEHGQNTTITSCYASAFTPTL